MSDRKESVKRGFAVAGAVTLLLAVGIVVLAGTTPVTLLLFAWFATAGGLLLVAGVRERISLGDTGVGWPRIGAVGLATLALGSTTLGFTQLLAGAGGWTLLNGVVMLFVGFALVLFALECWLGGAGMDPETFAVD
ncbi:hypothetical protein [Natronococcus sp.]|uniref:hypothetical protein n=1 Tax=Natronococcus sp. TaxID=35747 RepID=UPI0025D11A29|nr:hypothetical protein [Natronococcus sp.]